MNRIVVSAGCALGPTTASGDTGTPSRYSCWYSLPSRWMVRSKPSPKGPLTTRLRPRRLKATGDLDEESSNAAGVEEP